MILVNGQTADTIAAQDRGLLYGDGVFETIAVSDGEALALDEHLIRLRAGANLLRFPEIDYSVLLDEISEAVEQQGSFVLKIILTRGTGGRGYQSPGVETVPNRIIYRYDWPQAYTAELYKDGMHAIFCKTRLGHNPALAGVKHLNRLEQVLARSEWDNADIHEGIVCDLDGNVIEGCSSNLFLVNENTLTTPSLDHCGVHGVMRKLILNAAAEAGLDTQVKSVKPDDLYSADELFFCNSLLGLCHVRTLLKHEYSSSTVTSRLRNTLVKQNKILSI